MSEVNFEAVVEPWQTMGVTGPQCACAGFLLGVSPVKVKKRSLYAHTRCMEVNYI